MPESAALYRHRGTRAVQRMVEFAPSTGGLALWVAHVDQRPGDAAVQGTGLVAPVSTDGHTLLYAASFEQLPIAQQVGAVAHEVLHIALRHPQRYLDLQQLLGDVDLALFNVCADAIVNSTLGHLSWLELLPRAVTLDKLLSSALDVTQSEESALLEWDVERLYRAIDDRRPAGSREGGTQRSPKGGAGGRREDGAHASRADGPHASRARALGEHTALDLQPGAQTRAAPEEEADATREWSERLVRAHAGDGVFSMLRTLLADLPRTRTPWEQLLRTQLARHLSTRPGIAWSRPARSYIANQGRAGPHRRMPWEPGIAPARRVPRLVVVVDVSGSVDDALMERFAREIESITRRLEASLVLVIGDDRVQQVEEFGPGLSGLREIAFQGGGGTDFTPLLEEAGRHRPDIVLVLTDLQGPARERPRWPVIWAVPEAFAAAEPAFGRKIVLR
ncbi:MAG TPA: VWA-like domain-containing protein [Rubrivivax sp.]